MLSTVNSMLSLLFQLSYKAVILWKSMGYTSWLAQVAAGSKHHQQWYVQFVRHHGCQWHRGRRVFMYTWDAEDRIIMHTHLPQLIWMPTCSDLWEQGVCMMILVFRLRTTKLSQGNTMGSDVPSVQWHRGYNCYMHDVVKFWDDFWGDGEQWWPLRPFW